MFKIKMTMLMATIIMTIFFGSADHDVITMMIMTMIMVMTMMTTMMMMISPAVYHGASVADHRTHCGPARFASNDLFFLAIPTRVILIMKRLLS